MILILVIFHKLIIIIGYYTSINNKIIIEPFLFGIVLGMIPVSLAGLFVAAYLQYRRGNQLI